MPTRTPHDGASRISGRGRSARGARRRAVDMVALVMVSNLLSGTKVVDLTSVVLGPYATQMLGDLGADVIKVEPPGGDTNRNLGPHRNHTDMGSMYLGCNRNKRSVALDLKSEKGKQAALEIMKSADVVVHNFRPQAMDRLGLDYQAVKAVNPEVIYCA